MKRQSRDQLEDELRSVGASDTEVSQLTTVAHQLHHFGKAERAQQKSHRTRHIWVPMSLSTVAGLAIGMALVILSQVSLPGSMLYPVQKLSDSVAVWVHPQYRGDVMMKSAQQVRQLVTNHANSQLVLATLTDYQREASLYASQSANYADFTYCKNTLQQTASVASPPERQAINQTLHSLDSI